MCAFTGVILGQIQPGKGDPEVTGEHGNRKSVRHTPGLRLLHGRVHALQGVGNEVLLLFLLMPTLHQGQASIKTACEYSLLFLYLIAHSSVWKRKQLWVRMLSAFLKIFCVLWYLKVFYDSSCWMYKTIFQLQLSFPRFLNKLTYLSDALSKNIMLSWQILSKTANSEWNQCKAVIRSHTRNLCSTKQLTVLNFFQIVGHI